MEDSSISHKSHSSLLKMRKTQTRSLRSSITSFLTCDKVQHSRVASDISFSSKATVKSSTNSLDKSYLNYTPIKSGKKRDNLGSVEAIEHKVANRRLKSALTYAAIPSNLSHAPQIKVTSPRTPHLDQSESKQSLKGLSQTCKLRLAQFTALDNMLETAELEPIKSYIRTSSREYKSKLSTLKQKFQFGALEAREARLRRWKNARFNKLKDEKDLTNKEIREIVGQWRREMKRFIFK
mmetsp:Transcript_6840/g.12384  ORF Transcript_6840/g.12384 Transcript_6840/m.12384 type:complete len:237 (+) Transcript_6840:1211-1921(+)